MALTFTLEYYARIPLPGGEYKDIIHTVGWELFMPQLDNKGRVDQAQKIHTTLKAGNQNSPTSDLIWGRNFDLKAFDLEIVGVLSDDPTPPPNTNLDHIKQEISQRRRDDERRAEQSPRGLREKGSKLGRAVDAIDRGRRRNDRDPLDRDSLSDPYQRERNQRDQYGQG